MVPPALRAPFAVMTLLLTGIAGFHEREDAQELWSPLVGAKSLWQSVPEKNPLRGRRY